MQRVGLDAEAAVGGRRDFQFLVAVVQPFGALAQRLHFRHFRAQGGAGAVRADQRMERPLHLLLVVAEGGDAVDEVHPLQCVVEVHARAVGFGDGQQHDVQLAAVDRPDHFRIVAAVALQAGLAVQRMHVAATHHHRLLQDRVVGTGLAQCVQSAFGQGEVDRATAGVAVHARVAASLEHVHRPAAPGQQDGEQGAGQAAADDGDIALSAHRATP